MKTYIYLNNYRGFTDALIPLEQVNWLVGENSTGKTSFLDILSEIYNPAFWIFEPAIGLFNAEPRHFMDMVSASIHTKSSFTVGAISVSNSKNIDTRGLIVTYGNRNGRALQKRVSIILGSSIRSVTGKLWARKDESYRARNKSYKTTDSTPLNIARDIIETHTSSTGFRPFHISEDRQRSPFFERFAEALFDGKDYEDRNWFPPDPFGVDLVKLAPIRTKPRRTYDESQTRFSPEGEHTPYVIRRRLSSKLQADEFRNFMEAAGQDSHLFQSIRIKEYGRGSRDPFEVQIILNKTPLGIENVGYGVSQALPVIVEMFIRPKGTTFSVQQPEVHLHPRAQASFGDIVADISRKEGKNFIIETHSDFSIDRFRLNIRENRPIPAQLLYFERSNIGNNVTPIPIDDKGNLPADQPSGYREFFFNESLSLLG